MARKQRLDEIPLDSLSPDLAFRLGVEYAMFCHLIYERPQPFDYDCMTANQARLVHLAESRSRSCRSCWIHEDQPEWRRLRVGPAG